MTGLQFSRRMKSSMRDKKLDHLVQPDTVICKNENIAGVTVPAFQELTFKDIAMTLTTILCGLILRL